MELKQIAVIETGFPEKFGIPRQSGLVSSLRGRITFLPEYRTVDAVRGLEEYSHLWIMWEFSKAKREHWSATVTPPRLGGKERVGVFATRSPFRTNPIGLSCVKLEQVLLDEKCGPVIEVSGVDMLDGTPVYDIKPYLPYVDSHPDAVGGFGDRVKEHQLEVVIPEDLLLRIHVEDQEAVRQILEQDPRTAFIHDEERVWGVFYKNYNIRFTVQNHILIVREVQWR